MLRTALIGFFALAALILVGVGFLFIYGVFTEETFEANFPFIYAILGTGLLNAGILVYLSIAAGRSIRFIRELKESIDKNTNTNIQIAKRQQAEQKRQSQAFPAVGD